MSSRPYFLRRPVENAAVARTAPRPAPTATVPELRHRLVVALGADDAHGVLLLAHHLRRAEA